jgi:hypothetical protein
MSVLIKALTRQLDARLPFSRTTLLIIALWAGTFTAFITLGLSR